MATLCPFRALRPVPSAAAAVASVPYDVVSTDEARALADGNPRSFLRVSRAELELPPDTDPYADAVYERAAQNYARLTRTSFELESEPSVYVYRLRMGAHTQTGLAGCFLLDEYDSGIIKKHERTRRDKEDDCTRHMLALGAQTGPVFLTYRASADVNDLVRRATSGAPLFDFTAGDGVQHTLWRVPGQARDQLVAAFLRIPGLYIADGHHRAASAARARDEIRTRGGLRQTLGDGADFTAVLAVAFPHDQVQVLAYNRTVKNLAGLSPGQFLDRVRDRFDVAAGTAVPESRGRIAMYFGARWHALTPKAALDPSDAIGSLDVSILQDSLLAPVLGIADVRTDKRIDFIGGARGTAELERLVEAGAAAVAFSLYPVSVADLMAVSDAGGIMPPKSTWFEPKLRDGLLVHVILIVKVLIADTFEQSGLDLLRAAGCDVIFHPELADAALRDAIGQSQADVLVVRSTKVTAAMLDAGVLSLVVRAGAGYNTIDVAAASSRGIYVSNCPGKNAVAVAELTLALILALDRRVPDNVAELRAGKWNKKEFSKARGIFGSTLGLIGYGNIGQEVAARALGFGLSVVVWSRRFAGGTERPALPVTVMPSLAALADVSDIVSVHLALSAETRGMLGADFFARLKPRAMFINTARGEVVDYAALGQAVRERGIRVGLDVFPGEPAAATGDYANPLVGLPNVYGTHHIGGSTDQAQEAIAQETVRVITAYMKTGRVPNVVNLARSTPATHLLVVRHRDRPGVLAFVFDQLRENGINVQETENIIFEGAAAAVARINLDGLPASAVLDAMRSGNDDIIDVRIVDI